MKFCESNKYEKDLKTLNQDDGAEQGTYSKEYLENSLSELLKLQKIIDRDIRNIVMKLQIKEQGREIRYEKYPLKDVR